MPTFTFVADKVITTQRDVEATTLDEAAELFRAGKFTNVKQSHLPESLRLVRDQLGNVRMRYEGRRNLAGDAYDELLVSCYHVLVRVVQISSPADSLGQTSEVLLDRITLMRAQYAREVEPSREDWIAIAEAYLVVIELLTTGEVEIGATLAAHLRGSEAAVRRALAMARSSDTPSTARFISVLSGEANLVSFTPHGHEQDS